MKNLERKNNATFQAQTMSTQHGQYQTQHQGGSLSAYSGSGLAPIVGSEIGSGSASVPVLSGLFTTLFFEVTKQLIAYIFRSCPTSMPLYI